MWIIIWWWKHIQNSQQECWGPEFLVFILLDLCRLYDCRNFRKCNNIPTGCGKNTFRYSDETVFERTFFNAVVHLILQWWISLWYLNSKVYSNMLTNLEELRQIIVRECRMLKADILIIQEKLSTSVILINGTRGWSFWVIYSLSLFKFFVDFLNKCNHISFSQITCSTLYFSKTNEIISKIPAELTVE